eukprot:m.331723 g.331723  ORF g.331723 m.331723 type:complete len:241 (+) comp19773_c0_seq4:4434-5156(+)
MVVQQVVDALAGTGLSLPAAASATGDDGVAPTPTTVGARVIFGRDEGDFAFLSGPGQPWPFVAVMDDALLQAMRNGQMALMKHLGFEEDWVQERVDGGTRFKLCVFNLAECGECVSPTWDGLRGFVQAKWPAACAAKLEPHVATMSAMPMEQLFELARGVERVDEETYARVRCPEEYATRGLDTLREARAFLRHTLKCTELFTGTGYTCLPDRRRGSREFLVPRSAVADLPSHCFIDLDP